MICKLNSIKFFLFSCLLPIFVSGSFVDSHDVSWTFGNSSFFSYELTSYTPLNADLGTIGNANPTLKLHIGQRYEVKITSYISHPFEVIAKGATAAGDIVLLSMKPGIDPPLESDAQINWTDSGTGTVTFTMTSNLYKNMIAGGRIPGS